jgi:PRTRC genetic system protein B
MDAGVHLGATTAFSLAHAVLVYSDGRRAFATIHDPAAAEAGGAPTLGPGRVATTAFLKALATQLGESVPADVLPPNLLVRTSDVTVWWRPASTEALFYNPAKNMGEVQRLRALSGKRVPIPPLVFRATRSGLWVRALRQNTRPEATTRLATAPFYNVGKTGSVCVGSMRRPLGRGLETLPLWERAFFESEFTHILPGVIPVRHAGGFLGMWVQLAKRGGPRAFPATCLADAPGKQTLGRFVTADKGGDW